MRSMTPWARWLVMRSRGRLQSWCPLAAWCSYSKSDSMQPARRDCTDSDRNRHQHWKHRHWKQADHGLQHSICNCPHCCMGTLAGFAETAAAGFGARSLVDIPRCSSTQDNLLAVRCSSSWASSCHLHSASAVAERSAVPVGSAGTERAWVYKKESPAVGFLVDQPRIGHCLPGFAVGFREDTVQDGRDRRYFPDCQSTDRRGWHCSQPLRPCCVKAQ